MPSHAEQRTLRVTLLPARAVDCATTELRMLGTAAGLAEAVSLVDERLVVAKMQRHLLTKFLTLTFLCYLVRAQLPRLRMTQHRLHSCPHLIPAGPAHT